ncbi:MAG: translation initiation factor IF-2 associated domain-containing protein, partial [Arsenophonus sp. NC-QC1-MAG3]
MTDETVKSLAAEVQTSVERLVQQFADAGIKKTENDPVFQNEKETLLAHLNREDGTTGNQTGKLTLQRKTRSTLSVPSAGGKSKSVNIEVRKKYTYIDRYYLEKTKAKEQVKHETEKKEKREAAEKEKIKQSKNKQKTVKANQYLAAYTKKQCR